ncbi:MAG: ATP-binding protein [Thermodesulfobacteriota bacterium]
MADELSRLQWILKNSISPEYEISAPAQQYGDLTELNRCRRILDAAGTRTLTDIAGDAIGLLDTSVAVYEETGDYAFGLFASGWCRLMDSASRRLCGDVDNRRALECGKWLCHESCWNDAAKTAIRTGRPADIECAGGIRIYAEPVFAGGRPVGSINIGYGNPPNDSETLETLARRFNVDFSELKQAAEAYVPRPDIVVDIAKKRLRTAARLLGQMVEKRGQELELLDYRRRMDTLMRNLPGMAYRCRNGKPWSMEFVSEGSVMLTGYEPEELVCDRVAAYGDLVHPEDADYVWRKVQDSLEQDSHFEIEYRIVTRSGNVKWVWERGLAIDEAENGTDMIEGFISDITAKKQAEEKQLRLEKQVHHGRRMEAVGRLAGGIAHDFNNLLFVILGYAEMMLRELPEGSEHYGRMKEINHAALRGRDLIKQLLAFGRRQMLEMKEVDVHRVISGIEKMLARIIGEDVGLEVNLGAESGFVKADESQIEQILMNLAVNSRDAMPEGGVLCIETEVVNIEKDDEAAETGELEPGPCLLISVRDTGEGMDRDTLDRIFEPFFSTKSREKGTGLGLSTVYGIVRQHEGKIRVHSEPGKGTCFMIYLPLAEVKQAENPAGSAAAHYAPVREEPARVLVVEDDPAVRDLSGRILADQGYSVIYAETAYDAVEKANEPGQVIDLLLTDVVMPEMNGPEVYSRISGRHPEMKVIYMSGYSENVLNKETVENERAGFIQKPFTIRELRQQLSITLAQ